MTTRKTWLAWLQVVLVLLFLYSLVLVFAGGVARSMFSAFGFGPSDAIDTDEVRDYLELPFMVLGAVMAGWTFMMLQIVRGPLRDGAAWALPALTRSLVLWFVLDTGIGCISLIKTCRVDVTEANKFHSCMCANTVEVGPSHPVDTYRRNIQLFVAIPCLQH